MGKFFTFIGEVSSFGLKALVDAFRPPFEWEFFVFQIEEIGWQSLPLILAAGFALGVVLSMHTRGTLVQFGAEALIPSLQSASFFNELGPLITALLVAGRVGAGIGAGIANMRVTEQIDAIESLSVDSFKMLVVTRIVACILILPMLTLFMDFASMAGGFLAEYLASHISLQLYLNRAFKTVEWANFIPPTAKNQRFRFHHRYRVRVFRLYHGRRVRRSAARGYQQRGSVFASDHLGGCRPCESHLLPLSKERRMSDPAAVEFEHVFKTFGNRKVLDDVSFKISEGEALCIMGRSGTGKSTSLRLMIGLLKPDSGRVCIGSEDIVHSSEEDLSRVRRHMGFLFQSAALLDSFTLGDNLALPLRRLDKSKSPSEIKRAVDETLERVGLDLDIAKMPSELSGGMRKRAGLARALVLHPKLLLVDEPSSGLDRITASEIDDLLLKVKQEYRATLVIVTHDVRGARKVGDRIAVLDQGRLIGFGTATELDKSDHEIVRRLVSES